MVKSKPEAKSDILRYQINNNRVVETGSCCLCRGKDNVDCVIGDEKDFRIHHQCLLLARAIYEMDEFFS